ncbi:MAG TPA: Wadjet anti-phage system protein JetD domain-containing protein [Phnomibacter sp.]|nr:Wadjet anti-phage system protein JetD domain-containing protein [Phnomibacter sp.]
MITHAELHKKIERVYWKLLSAHVEQSDIFPCVIAADKSLPDDFAAWTKALDEIIAHSSDRNTFGYHIDYETKQTRKHGEQSIPVQFRFDSKSQLLQYLGKQEEFELFVANTNIILNTFPVLKSWLGSKPKIVIEFHASWKAILNVLEYFVSNPKPQLFLRELPIVVHTKFIEQHKGLLYELLNEVLPIEAINQDYGGVTQFEQRFGLRIPPQRIRVRILDPIFAAAHTGGFSDIELTVDEWSTTHLPLKQVIVMENKKNFENADIFLSLPFMQATAVIFGSGRAVSLLGRLPWLKDTAVLYWGDIDAEGFEILHQLRSILPQTNSFCMDEVAFLAFQLYVVKGSGAVPRHLPLLTGQETALYTRICQQNERLEQERLPHAYVLNQLNSLPTEI